MRQADTGEPRRVDSVLARGAVRVPGIHKHRTHPVAEGREVFTADDDRRGDELICREHGGSRRWCVRHGKREIGAAALLDAGGNGAPAEAQRQNEGLVRGLHQAMLSVASAAVS